MHWAEVIVPKGLEVVDERLEGHGFTTADGIVLEGKVLDLATGRPVAGRMRLERLDPRKGVRNQYVVVARADADPQGRWVLKKAPTSGQRVVVEADGYVPRIAGYARFDEQPRWVSYDSRTLASRPRLGTGHRRIGRAAGLRRGADRPHRVRARWPL